MEDQKQQEEQEKANDKEEDIATQEYDTIIKYQKDNQHGEDDSTDAGEQNQEDIETQQYEHSSEHGSRN
eukprot:5463493-Heterocapsa_arctica.AAC.1